MSLKPPVTSPATVIPFPSRQSFGKLQDISSGEVFDRHCYCKEFQEKWTVLMNAVYQGNAVACAERFGISERGAAKWLDGLGGPRGDKVGIAVRTIPGAAEFLFGSALARAA